MYVSLLYSTLVRLCFHTLLAPLTSMIIIFEDSVEKIKQSDDIENPTKG